MELDKYLKFMLDKDASDLYLTVNAPPEIKVHGLISKCDAPVLQPGETKEIAYKIMHQDQITEFEQKLEMNLAIFKENIGRFRINIFKQRGEVGIVIRSIKTIIPTLAELNLPPILAELIMAKRGLILIVGATSSGKSTTLASMIEHRNNTASGHIVTIEDPIEYVHNHKQSIINQREVGIDTLSYENALKNTLRQAPDVILIGEIRSQDTMQYAITFAETGHLCLSTLHANNANQAFDRVINFFAKDTQRQLLLDLSLNTVAIVSQRLIPSTDGKRVPAVEVLLATPLIKDLIFKGEITQLKEVMEKSSNLGMQTFDMALFDLYKQGLITEKNALAYADSANNLRIKIAMSKGAKPTAGDDLTLKE